MIKPIFELKDINFSYQDGTAALKGVNVAIEKAEKVFVHGENGAGKTTLFQCMNGLLKPKSGDILIKEKKITKSRELMQNVGIVFQNADDQIIAGSVYEEISFGPMNMGWSEADVKKRVEQVLSDMGLQDLANKPPHFLSYGQKKRVCIGAVLAMNPQILILDEPFANLDPQQTENYIHLFNILAKQGVTLIISSHDVNITWSMADRVVILHDGKVYKEGSVIDIFTDEELLSKVQLHKPTVLEIFQSLVSTKVLKDGLGYPRTKEELIKLIEEGGTQI